MQINDSSRNRLLTKSPNQDATKENNPPYLLLDDRLLDSDEKIPKICIS